MNLFVNAETKHTETELRKTELRKTELRKIHQEGWLSPTEHASVSAISLSLKHILATPGESRRYVVAFHPFCGWRHMATSRESNAHFGLPGYAPGTIAVNVTWIERGFNTCQTHRSM